MIPELQPWRVRLNCSGETLGLGISQALRLILECNSSPAPAVPLTLATASESP